MGTLTEQHKKQGILTVRLTDDITIVDITSLGELEVFFSPLAGVITDANPQTFEDTSFIEGDSPVTLDANTALGRNATKFIVYNTGAGALFLETSNDGVTFGDQHRVASGEVFPPFDLGVSVDSLRITHIEDTGYKVVVI